IAGVATAAETGKFVQQGDAAKALLETNTINIATAEAIGKACVDEATKEGVKISIVITDQFGEPVYFYRMDGQGKINVDTAFMKAKTALNMRAPSKSVMNQVLQGRATELRQYSFGNFANSGALPIIVNGNQLIGVVGVGGSAPKVPVWSDEICAWRALNKVIGPQPPLLPDVQRNAAAGGAGPRGAGAPNR
ncbi:MAG: heme-binding protein, partial [Alphaproteobacteria bacterium]|nr:heme-binding protein [Alphaproteobacteria bacterium]